LTLGGGYPHQYPKIEKSPLHSSGCTDVTITGEDLDRRRVAKMAKVTFAAQTLGAQRFAGFGKSGKRFSYKLLKK